MLLSVFTGFNNNVNSPLKDLIFYQLSSIQISHGLLFDNLSFFMNNLLTVVSIILMGLSFSILSVLSILFNSSNVGLLLSNNSFNILLLIIELIYLVFSLTGALLVTKMEVRFISSLLSGNRSDMTKKLKVPLKDLILSLFFIIILLILESLIYLI